MHVYSKSLHGGCIAALLSVASLAAQSANQVILVNAVAQRDAATVSSLLQQGVDVNTPQADGTMPLHWAVQWDDLGTADLLIRAGANVNAANNFGVTPLRLACTNGNGTMVQRLLNAGANPNALSMGEPPLLTATHAGALEPVRLLLGYGANVNAKETTQGQTALMWAAAAKRPDIVRVLVENGADVHAHSNGGFTPLLFSTRAGDLDSGRILVTAGADVNENAPDLSQALSEREGVGANDTRYISPLLVATVRGHASFAKYLLEQGADPNADGAGYTALHWAAGSWESELTGVNGLVTEDEEWKALSGVQRGKRDLIKSLLAYGADPNARLLKRPPVVGFTQSRRNDGTYPLNIIGATAFWLAAKAGDVEVMRALVHAGADPRLTTTDGTTALMVAAGIGRVVAESRVSENDALAAATLALELGIDINAANDAGDTALHGAAFIRSNALVQLFVDRGAQINPLNKAGQTPLTVAESTVQFAGRAVSLRTSTGDLLRKLGAR